MSQQPHGAIYHPAEPKEEACTMSSSQKQQGTRLSARTTPRLSRAAEMPPPLPGETELAALQMRRQCRHWNVGCMFPHRWQGCSWLVGGLRPTPGGSTLLWAFQEGPGLRERREMAITQLPSPRITWGSGMGGCVLSPRKGRHTHNNPTQGHLNCTTGITRVPHGC